MSVSLSVLSPSRRGQCWRNCTRISGSAFTSSPAHALLCSQQEVWPLCSSHRSVFFPSRALSSLYPVPPRLAGWLLPFQEVKGKLFPFDGHWAGRKRLFPADPLSGSLRELVWHFVQYFLPVLPTCHNLEEGLQSQTGPDWPGISLLQRP